METAQSYFKEAEDALAKGRACLLEADKLAGETKSAKEVEAGKWLDQAESRSALAQKVADGDALQKKLADLKQPIRKFAIAGGDDPKAVAEARKELERKAFDSYLRHGNQWQAELVESGVDAAQVKALTSLSDPEGGFILRQDMRTELITRLRDLVQIESLSRVIDTNAAAVGFPTFDPGDLSVPFTQEGQTTTVVDPATLFGKANFTPYTRRAIFQAPHELVEDASTDIASVLLDYFAGRLAELKEADYLRGTGMNQPLGLLGSTAIPKRDIAGSTTAVVPEDLIDTAYSLKAQYRRVNVAWLMHRNMVAVVRKMRDLSGGAGTGQWMWQPGLQAGQPALILSFPLVESEFFTDPFAGGAVAGDAMAMLGDFRWYWIIRRLDFTVQRLDELYAASGKIGFLMRARYDASPVLAEPFIRLNRK